MLFFVNLKNIIDNLPLILSDSSDAREISFTRVLIAFLSVIVSILAYQVTFNSPEYLALLMPYIADIVKSILALVVANIAKRTVYSVVDIVSKKNGDGTNGSV